MAAGAYIKGRTRRRSVDTRENIRRLKPANRNELAELIGECAFQFLSLKGMDNIEVEANFTDKPDIAATWSSREDSLSRVINVYVSETGTEIKISGSAWVDHLMRHSLQVPLGSMNIETLTAVAIAVAMGIHFEKIFAKLTQLRVDDLAVITPLQPLPDAKKQE